MSNKNSKRKALSDDALENVSGGMNFYIDAEGYRVIYSLRCGTYRIKPSPDSFDLNNLIKLICNLEKDDSTDDEKKKYMDDLEEFKQYKISDQ